ncbi:MAG: hypothetical protein FWB71_00750 [Defluviitaleaceae bacterium]|nr:hypothetical protein [Defluviitaleaceae bacterium]
MPRRTKNYEHIFNTEQTTIDDYLENLRDKNIAKYWTKFIKSGDFLEISIYPLWKTSKADILAAMPKPSRDAQILLNHKNRTKHIARIMHCNFTIYDIWATLTYDTKHLPADGKAALRDMQNCIRRLKRYIKKHNLPDLKYIYVTENRIESGEIGRVHHHIIMNFADRDVAEKLWGKSQRNQTRYLSPDDFGLEGMANYLTKEKHNTEYRKHTKSYGYSKNLVHPIIERRENLIRKRKAENIAKNPDQAPKILHDLAAQAPKTIRGQYDFLDLEAKYSNYIGGVYLYARMRMRQTPSTANKRKRKPREEI